MVAVPTSPTTSTIATRSRRGGREAATPSHGQESSTGGDPPWSGEPIERGGLPDIPVPLFRLGADGVVFDANAPWADLVGLARPDAARGMPLARVMPSLDVAHRLLRRALREGSVRGVRIVLRRADGILVPARVSLHSLMPARGREDAGPHILGVAEVDDPGALPLDNLPDEGADLPAWLQAPALRALAANPEWSRFLLEAADRAGIGLAISVYPADAPPSLAFLNRGGAELLGQPLESLLHGAPFPRPLPEEEERMRDAGSSHGGPPAGPVMLQRTIERPGSHPRTVEVVLSEGTYWGEAATFALLQDVTDRRRAEAERAEARARARELEHLRTLDRSRAQFLNTAAHQLFTPLTPMRMQLHLLGGARAGGLTEAQRRSLEVLDLSLARLEALAKELLEAADVQARLVIPDPRPTDLAAIAGESVAEFLTRAEDKGVAVHLDAPGPACAQADPGMVRRILHHLLSNAVKFTPGGGTVQVHVRPPRGNAPVEVAVEDTGTGFTREEAEGLFQPFKGHGTARDAQGGWGLGLRLCRSLAELQGGSLAAASRGPDLGAIFTLALPAAGEAAPRSGATPAAPP